MFLPFSSLVCNWHALFDQKIIIIVNHFRGDDDDSVMTEMRINIIVHSGFGACEIRISPVFCAVFDNKVIHELLNGRVCRVVAGVAIPQRDFIQLFVLALFLPLFLPLLFLSRFAFFQLFRLRVCKT